MHAPEEEFAAVLMPYSAPAEGRSTSANPGNRDNRHQIEPNDVGGHSLLRTISGNAGRECDASIIKKYATQTLTVFGSRSGEALLKHL
ncbi:hypothetical protein ASC80_11890 [Afipia sp. Root123D2]|uniref:hypothetical protein n=1 Tax=Afipia sp. Root123D2 TaxID=1736436 RepID=UPI0006FB54BB|nr:hypothetical protein [Afipia sp. Root123D2]KQW20870.1 hypothetical protein ASC80_11890 [Afipia sp. Root123D2]